MVLTRPFSHLTGLRLLQTGGLSLALVVATAGLCWAATPDIQLSLSENTSWDSNPLMKVEGIKSLYGSSLTPKVLVTNKNPLTDLNVEAAVTDNRFNQAAFNSTDFHGKANLSQAGELWKATLRVSGDYDTTRTSELTTLGLDVGSVRHKAYSVGSEISYNVTPLDKASLSGSFLNATYDSRNLSDYRIFSASPSWTHSFNPLNQGMISIQAQRYQSLESEKAEIDSIGPSIGWISSLSPRLTAQLSAGSLASKQKSRLQAAQEWKWNYIFSGSLTYTGDQNSTVVSATRSRQPYANGTESLLTTLSLEEKYKFNSALSLNLRGVYQFAKQPPSSGSNLDSMWSASAGLAYHFTDEWAATTSYQYRCENLTDRDIDAKQSVVRMGFLFQPTLGK